MKNMQLVKRQEDVNRTYDSGEQKETVNRAHYTLLRDGSQIGTADVHPTSLNLNIYNAGFDSIEENTALLEKLFAAVNTEE